MIFPTCLRLIAGFEQPTTGHIEIFGERADGVPPYKRHVNTVFQDYALFPHMTILDNVAYGLKTRHVPKAERDRRVAEVLELVKLTGKENRRPRQLSGGQQQRVALARALVINPTVLLLDEPFSALDKSLRTSMQVELREIQRKLGLTTIFVTHDQSEALSLSDRVAVMSEGRIRQLGTPVDIYRAPMDRFVATFVGDNNRLRGTLLGIEAADAIIALGDASVRVPKQALASLDRSSAVDVFVRPEQFNVVGPNDPCAVSGNVVAQIYQGGHVDLHVECPGPAHGRLLIRSAGDLAVARWPIGARVGVAVQANGCVAFPAE